MTIWVSVTIREIKGFRIEGVVDTVKILVLELDFLIVKLFSDLRNLSSICSRFFVENNKNTSLPKLPQKVTPYRFLDGRAFCGNFGSSGGHVNSVTK